MPGASVELMHSFALLATLPYGGGAETITTNAGVHGYLLVLSVYMSLQNLHGLRNRRPGPVTGMSFPAVTLSCSAVQLVIRSRQ